MERGYLEKLNFLFYFIFLFLSLHRFRFLPFPVWWQSGKSGRSKPCAPDFPSRICCAGRGSSSMIWTQQKSTFWGARGSISSQFIVGWWLKVQLDPFSSKKTKLWYLPALPALQGGKLYQNCTENWEIFWFLHGEQSLPCGIWVQEIWISKILGIILI